MYKGVYIIGIYSYDKYELCETILDNVNEFAAYVGLSLNVARSKLSQIFNHKSEYVVINGKWKKVEFINVIEYE